MVSNPGTRIEAPALSWRGLVRIVARDPRGETIDERDLENLVTNDGLNLWRDALKGDVVDAQIKYIALGDDPTAPADADSALGNELFRKQVTDRETTGNGVLVTTALIASNEGNFQIEEIGWYAGAGASGTTDSGVLVARVLYSRLKNNLESLQIERTDTIA